MVENGKNASIWDNLSERQINAVSFKLSNPDATYAEVSAELDIPEQTLGNWRLNKIVAEVRKDTAQSIVDYAKRASLRAIRVLEAQMDSDDERIAQSASKELLDRFMGKTAQRQIHEGDDNRPVTIRVEYADYNPKTS